MMENLVMTNYYNFTKNKKYNRIQDDILVQTKTD